MDDIEAIIDGCKRNNRAAQKILYDRYFERLYVHSQRYRLDDQECVTLINKTMLKVFQKIDSYKGDGVLESWIHSIHKYTVLDHFRSITRRNSQIGFSSDIVAMQATHNGLPDNQLELEYIYQAMDSLPDQTREVLKLYAIQGFKHKEIAGLLNMSESSSKYHLSKAREMMAEKLKKNHG